jgi:hypothetical protein
MGHGTVSPPPRKCAADDVNLLEDNTDTVEKNTINKKN